MIHEREEAIRAFKPEEYWEVKSHLLKNKGTKKNFLAQVVKENGKKFRPNAKAVCDKAVKVLETKPYEVTEVEKKPGKSKPSAPYITSTLQQAASHRLRYGVKVR